MCNKEFVEWLAPQFVKIVPSIKLYINLKQQNRYLKGVQVNSVKLEFDIVYATISSWGGKIYIPLMLIYKKKLSAIQSDSSPKGKYLKFKTLGPPIKYICY